MSELVLNNTSKEFIPSVESFGQDSVKQEQEKILAQIKALKQELGDRWEDVKHAFRYRTELILFSSFLALASLSIANRVKAAEILDKLSEQKEKIDPKKHLQETEIVLDGVQAEPFNSLEYSQTNNKADKKINLDDLKESGQIFVANAFYSVEYNKIDKSKVAGLKMPKKEINESDVNYKVNFYNLSEDVKVKELGDKKIVLGYGDTEAEALALALSEASNIISIHVRGELTDKEQESSKSVKKKFIKYKINAQESEIESVTATSSSHALKYQVVSSSKVGDQWEVAVEFSELEIVN